MKLSTLYVIGLFLLSVAAGSPLSAQSDTTRVDTTANDLSLDSDAAEGEGDGTDAFVMTKSPVAAVLWGIIPGGGQFYTEQYWKIPLFVLPIAGLTGLAIHNESKRAEFAQVVDTAAVGTTTYSNALTWRQTYQDRRDLSIAIAGGVWILSLVDAYVGAHLYDFDVGDSLASGRIYADPIEGRVGVAVVW